MGASATEAPTAMVGRLFDAVDKLDFTALGALMADDIQGIDEISRRWRRGRDSMLDYFRLLEGQITDVRSEVRDVHETVDGDTATVTFVLDQRYWYHGDEVRLSAPTTIAMRRAGESWELTLLHSVPLPDAPEG